MKKYSLLAIVVLLFGGCAIFRPPLEKQLEPLQMTYVEGGTYMMGDVIYEENDDSLPLHEVTLPDFEIATYETTYRQYDAFARATERPLPRDDNRGRGERAVIYVTWDEALAFCKAYGYRLPTEQEWEYTARSRGKKHEFSGTSSRDSLDYYARYLDNSVPFAFNVGTKEPNDLGLYDMSGNVAEYIGEYYPFFKTNPDSIEYYPLEERGMRVIRGGSFNSSYNTLSTYWRVGVLGELRDHTIGFRCARSLD